MAERDKMEQNQQPGEDSLPDAPVHAAVPVAVVIHSQSLNCGRNPSKAWVPSRLGVPLAHSGRLAHLQNSTDKVGQM